MAQTNHERVGRALELLNAGLSPFVERHMQAQYGAKWPEEVSSNMHDHQVAALTRKDARMDTQVLLLIVWDYWNAVFRNVFGKDERSLVSELRTSRNKWAHQEPFSTDDAHRTLDNIFRLLTAVSATQQASEVDRQKLELLRLKFEEQTRQETRKMTTAALEGKPTGGLLPWRSIVTPHPDVTSGRYQEAEFAADLGQVHRGEGSDEYRKPRDFFQRTYFTHGLRQLLVRALQRMSGSGGDPVVDLQTNFGGGKTHSLLALYHLFSGAPLADLVGTEELLKEAGVTRPVKANRAVLVGHALSPSGRVLANGMRINTLWGELAYQLLDADGYAMVAEADRRGVSPGTDVLRDLFTVAAPCLILIDELVVYMRQIYHIADLPAGSFDANLSFVQSLTEAAKTTPQTLLVATIPESESEQGGVGGVEATLRLKNIIGRVESPWRPAEAEEGFGIVRRRLFQDITDPNLAKAQYAVARAFVNLYREHPQEFPSECGETTYEQRIRDAYPIHPELFRRLYDDWSSIEKFQRTRGVLRLMAKVVHNLWQGDDKNLLILPSLVAVGDAEIKPELARYLEDNWDPVIEKDIDGSSSLAVYLDAKNTTLGRYAACRRVARTIYFGSAPTLRDSTKGLTEDRIKLGCVQPGEMTATFGDALRRLSDQSSHLYQDAQRYWYATQPSVIRLAQDRATQQDDDTVYGEIEKRLRLEQSTRADFARVHVCPSSSGDIGDDDSSVRLVILRPHLAHAKSDNQSAARREAMQMLETRGNSSRTNKNALIFLVADRGQLDALKEGVRQYLAWESIVKESDELNLDAFGRTQAQTKRESADKTVTGRIPETYIWLLVPTQEKLQSIMLEEFKLQAQSQPPIPPLATAVSRKLKSEDLLITQYAGTLLRRELDGVPLWRDNHLAVKTLAEYFAHYLYLPRLKNTDVLLGAIREGVQSPLWERETFAYADSWDEDHQRYLGLKTGQPVTPVSSGLLVKSVVAAAQLAAEAAEEARKKALQAAAYATTQQTASTAVHENGVAIRQAAEIPVSGATSPITQQRAAQPVVEKLQKSRFHGSIKINPRMMAGDAGKIMQEIVQHLTSLSKDGVTVTLEIQARIPDGIPVDVQQVVEENCRTLRFEDAGFEEE